MRRPTVSAAGISLFPFMAVLLCTMGALIVVLVVLNRQARVEAATETANHAVSQTAAVAVDLQEASMTRETIAWRLQHLATSREKTQVDLDHERLRLSGIEEHIRSLEKQLGELRQSLRSSMPGPCRMNRPRPSSLSCDVSQRRLLRHWRDWTRARKAAAERDRHTRSFRTKARIERGGGRFISNAPAKAS